jgi:hypothetical protein
VAPPVVVSSKVQKITGSGSGAVPGAIQATRARAYQNVRIRWNGSGENGVEAMADTGQFLVSAGYAKINTVEVPQRRGIAVFAGFDPVTATLPVMLDKLGESGFEVEEACQLLEYMAGQGYGPGGAYKGAAQVGLAPLPVIIEAFVQGGVNPSKLLPLNYNAADRHPSIEWYITGFKWGDSIRTSSEPYQRVRQKVTLTLTEYDPETTAGPAVAIKRKKVRVELGKGGKGQSSLELVIDQGGWKGNEEVMRAEEVRAWWNAKHSKKPGRYQRIAHINTPFRIGQEVEIPVKG